MIPLDQNFWRHAIPSLYRDMIKGPHHSTLNPHPEEYLAYSTQLEKIITQYREETGDLSVDQTIERIKALHGKRHLTVHFDGGIVRENGVNKYVAHAFVILEADEVIAKHVFRGSQHIDERGNPANSGIKMSTNIAEYLALFSALEHICEWNDDYQHIDLDIYTDCANVYNHLSTLCRSRNPLMLYLRDRGLFMLSRFRSHRLHNVPREENHIVDMLIREEFRKWRKEDARKG